MRSHDRLHSCGYECDDATPATEKTSSTTPLGGPRRRLTGTPDVLVIGGGVLGSAVAVHLLRETSSLDVVVIEPDPTYALAATPRASGGIRQLFTKPENILLSQYTHEVIRDWANFARADGEDPPDLGWKPQGYLFIAGPENANALAANLATQQAHGVRADWLSPTDLAKRYPYLATDDLGGGVLSPDDGWIDPSALLDGLRRKAIDLGAQYVKDRVRHLRTQNSRVNAAELESGAVLRAGTVVNTAGTWAPDLAAQVGMNVPVEPMRRFEHYIEVPADLGKMPFLKDPAGLAARPEGPGLSVGLVDFAHPGGFNLDLDHGYFDQHVWPALVHRMPILDTLRLRSTTVGLYDQNRLDGNPIIGNWPGRLDNFHLATGFSGHGLMHALGVGRGLAELILHGRYRTIDLHPLGYERILARRPYAEEGIR
ncbi:FAD-dependent oxidoreductase [Micromonospora sp. NPDC047707]|uniref:NAD(P)/FAD-dependent oxidoreductase n=1 Tax=Micromonospora sp. NPDC047707 TaxID=3154498 RepID=UPI0034522599